MVRSDRLGELTRAEGLTYLAIAGYVNGASWEASPSVPTLARHAQLHERSVQRAVKGLREKGWLNTIVGGGKGRTTRYILVTNPDPQEPPFKSPNPDHQTPPFQMGNPGDQGVTLSQQKPRQNEPETPAESALNPGNSGAKPRSPDAARTEGQKNSMNRGADDAAVEAKGEGPDSEVVKYLGTRGVESAGPRALVERFPGITVALCRELLAEVSDSAGGGARFRIIEHRMPKLLKRERDRRASESEAQGKLEQILTRLVAAYESDRATIDTTLNGLTASQLGELQEQATWRLASLLGATREAWVVVRVWQEGLTDPLTSGVFRVLLWQCKVATDQQRERAQAQAKAATEAAQREQAEVEERERQERERCEAETAWLTGLSEAALQDLFSQMVAESPNPEFRAKWEGQAPGADAIRRYHDVALIRCYGPYATGKAEPMAQLAVASSRKSEPVPT